MKYDHKTGNITSFDLDGISATSFDRKNVTKDYLQKAKLYIKGNSLVCSTHDIIALSNLFSLVFKEYYKLT